MLFDLPHTATAQMRQRFVGRAPAVAAPAMSPALRRGFNLDTVEYLRGHSVRTARLPFGAEYDLRASVAWTLARARGLVA
jgi:hypothetical protein